MAIAVDSEESHVGELAGHGNGAPERNERDGGIADLQDGAGAGIPRSAVGVLPAAGSGVAGAALPTEDGSGGDVGPL
jgi:hypothetical protein